MQIDPSAVQNQENPVNQKKPAMRVFISGANSLLGHSLFEELRNDHIAIQPDSKEEEHKFYVTLNQRDAGSLALPSKSMKVLNPRTKPKNFKKKILSSDLLVLDLLSATLSGGLDEIEKVIKTIRDHHSSPSAILKEQTLILVSSVMTWINTPKKFKSD